MAELSKNDVLDLARLAKLEINGQEAEQFRKEISSILQYVEQLSSLDLKEAEPTHQVTGLSNVMRLDKTIDYGPSPNELLKNAPDVQDGQIKVRRVL